MNDDRLDPSSRIPGTATGNPRFSPDDLFKKLINGNRGALGRAITLPESRNLDDISSKRRLMDLCRTRPGQSVRIGITGMPGAGKSTLIERLGLYVIARSHRVAVLAVDPTSELSGGSILGDKTRMEKLATNPGAFIRPSPNSGILGGVTEMTRETIILCEAAGYDVLLIETVGVGQAEFGVHAMVDYLILLTIAGAGDDLQGIKRGIMEMADAVFVNKSDGDRTTATRHAAADIRSALKMIPRRPGEQPIPVLTGSALTGQGIESLWVTASKYLEAERATGKFGQRRQTQRTAWFEDAVQYHIRMMLAADQKLTDLRKELLKDLDSGRIDPVSAASRFVEEISGKSH